MCTRTVRLVAILSLLVSLGTSAALAQTSPAPVPLILSKLPAQNSSAYKALKALAGNPQVQSLPLSKSEVWSVPAEKADALVQASGRYGVTVRSLNERSAAATAPQRRTRGPIPEASREPRDDWNQIFRLAPADVRINDKQKQMMEIASASRATTGVGIMETPLAPVIEYALTAPQDPQAPSSASPKITVALSRDTVLTIHRTRVEVRPRLCIWHGAVEGTNAPATILWWPDGKMAGSVQHQGRLYSIRHLGGEMHAVVELADERMPQEHAPAPAGSRRSDATLQDDPLVKQGDASALRPPRDASASKSADASAGKKYSQVALSAPSAKAAAKLAKSEKPAGAAGDVVIDVLVAYTKKAASYYADVKRELIDLAIEEGNESFRQSGLGQVKLRLVHAYQTDYVEEGAAHFDHVWRLADKGDGYLEEIHPLRDKYRADVGILVVDDAKGCGLATRVYADADEAFAVVHHECAASSYTLAHEIGHLIGARHDLNLDKSLTPFPYGHGFVNGTKWRDIMSYKESCNGCPRLPVWSNPKVLVRGEPAGTADLDNARVIAEQAARVAGFR